jgi:hypothetical protein
MAVWAGVWIVPRGNSAGSVHVERGAPAAVGGETNQLRTHAHPTEQPESHSEGASGCCFWLFVGRLHPSAFAVLSFCYSLCSCFDAPLQSVFVVPCCFFNCISSQLYFSTIQREYGVFNENMAMENMAMENMAYSTRIWRIQRECGVGSCRNSPPDFV